MLSLKDCASSTGFSARLRALHVTLLHRETYHPGRFRSVPQNVVAGKRMIVLQPRLLGHSESLDFQGESARSPPSVTPLQFPKP
jgi:hypothetical protein